MNALKSVKGEAYIALKKKNNKNKNFFYLSKNGNLSEAAKNLYSILRKVKKKGYKSIAIEKIINYGIGQSINDRLNRASKK
jgi:L-threonylcarbamoyladenylate synthase